jgi:hypothetical protein
MSRIHSSHSALVPLVNVLRVQTSRLDVEHSARKFVITDNTEEEGYENDYNVFGFDAPNPTLFLLAGLTYAFELDVSDPMVITEYENDESYVVDGMAYYNDLTLTKQLGVEANDGKKDGILYWTIPFEVSAEFKYQSTSNPAKFGTIKVKSLYNLTPMEPIP